MSSSGQAAETSTGADPELDPARLFQSLNGFSHVALAVSGGSDSLALLHLFNAFRRNRDGRATVLTVDHGLRAEAAAEARQVADWAKTLGLPHVTLRWIGPKPQTGIQAKARVARYDLLADWCRAQDAQVIVTGHTANDQAETVAMRRLRTSSTRSLAGIWPDATWKGIAVHRPLLGITRETLREVSDKSPNWVA